MGLLSLIEQVCEALGRHEHRWNNPSAWDMGMLSNEQIDRMRPAETPDCEDCARKRMGYDDDTCPNSRRSCGHHCDHSWTHDACCWCPARWGEDGIRLDRITECP